jgi:DNA-binding HxlR family transcriptional regulator
MQSFKIIMSIHDDGTVTISKPERLETRPLDELADEAKNTILDFLKSNHGKASKTEILRKTGIASVVVTRAIEIMVSQGFASLVKEPSKRGPKTLFVCLSSGRQPTPVALDHIENYIMDTLDTVDGLGFNEIEASFPDATPTSIREAIRRLEKDGAVTFIRDVVRLA